MKHASTRDLYCYWDGLRGTRLAPERADIDPAAIRGILTDTFILEVDDKAEYPFRLAGTRVCALIGHELRGTSLLDPWRIMDRAEIRSLLETVCNDAAAVVVGVEARSNQGAVLDLELLLLPLRHHGRTHARILGSLTAAEMPYWVGTSPIVSLTVRSSRILAARARAMPVDLLDPLRAKPLPDEPAGADSPAMGLQSTRELPALRLPALARRVAHLAVIQGGRS